MPTLLAPSVTDAAHPTKPAPGKPSESTRTASSRAEKLRLPSRDVENLTRNLETQLEAGVPIVRALQVHIDHAETPALAALSRGLLSRINSGAPLSDAMESYPHVFGPIYRSLVRSGEQSGHVPQMLHHLADFMAWRDDVRRTVKRAAIYPTLVLIATFGLFLFLIGFVWPRFEEMFARLGDDLPKATAALLWMGKSLSTHWLPLAAAAAAAVVALALPCAVPPPATPLTRCSCTCRDSAELCTQSTWRA